MIRAFAWLCQQPGPFVLNPEPVEGSKHERAVPVRAVRPSTGSSPKTGDKGRTVSGPVVVPKGLNVYEDP